MHDVSYLIRTGEPSQLDTAEYGALCKVTNNVRTSYYIQISQDAENPKWALIETDSESEAFERANKLRNKL